MRDIDTLLQPNYTSICSVPLQLVCSGGSNTNSAGSTGMYEMNLPIRMLFAPVLRLMATHFLLCKDKVITLFPNIYQVFLN
jgi:hypothetical protein